MMTQLPSTAMTRDHLLKLTQQLLDSITQGDYATYQALCDPQLTCFEPEAGSSLIQGLPFHQFFFNKPNTTIQSQQNTDNNTHTSSPYSPSPITTIASPCLRLCGSNADVAILAYTRLVQRWTRSENGDYSADISTSQETRIWEKTGKGWQIIHLHRSKL